MGSLSLAINAEKVAMNPPAGIKELYERHAETVYRTALRVTGNPQDAEDILQTVFVRLINMGERLDPVSTPERYFRRAATNAAVDVLRRRTTRGETSLDAGLGRASPESPALLKERLRRAIATLEPEDAELLLLRYVEGLSNGELAELLGVEKSRVAMRLYRLRQELQEELNR